MVVDIAELLSQARDAAYRAVDLVSFEGARYRRDIAEGLDG